MSDNYLYTEGEICELVEDMAFYSSGGSPADSCCRPFKEDQYPIYKDRNYYYLEPTRILREESDIPREKDRAILKRGTLVRVIRRSDVSSYISEHSLYDVVVTDLRTFTAVSMAHSTVGAIYASEIVRVSPLKLLALEGN